MRKYLYILVFALLLLLPGTALATDVNGDGYCDEDVAVINAMIENNGFGFLTKDDPASWEQYVTWDNSAEKKIISLDIYYHDVSGELNLSGLSNLQTLNCGHTHFTAIDLNGLSNLQTLNCEYTNITALDLSGLSNLQTLNCSSTSITALDLSSLSNLQTLNCSSTSITALDLSGLSNLQTLNCSFTSITALDLNSLSNLQELDCGKTNIAELDLSGLPNLTVLRCYITRIKTLDLSSLPNLQELVCSGIGITKIDLRDLPNLKRLDCKGTNITELDLSDLSYLEMLDCSYTFITQLDLSGLSNLTTLTCEENSITELDLSDLSNLTTLYCRKNDIARLDLGGCLSLTTLYCSDNNIAELDLSGLSSLITLECDDNIITSLNLSGLSSLTELSCINNNITQLDLSDLSSLEELYCGDNKITELNLSGLSSLIALDCSSTNIAELNLSSLTNLVSLGCSNTNITELDLSSQSMYILENASFYNVPFKSFTNPYGHTLHINVEGDGRVQLDFEFAYYDQYRYDYVYTLILTAEPLSGASFNEWTEVPEGAIVDGTEISFILNSDQTVTARFNEKKPGFSIQKNGWSFVNGFEGFGYPDGYMIPEERYREVFGDAYVAAAKKKDGKYYSSMIWDKWGGNCFGMCSVAALAYMDKLDLSVYEPKFASDYETVNEYSSVIAIKEGPRAYAVSGEKTPITKLIERYQVLSFSSQNYEESTFEQLEHTFWEKDNTKSTLLHTVYKLRDARNGGTYIDDILSMIKNSNVPLGLNLQYNGGAHQIMTRTDKPPKNMEDGWWRVYVYDPNTPYIDPALLSESTPESYYYNHILKHSTPENEVDRYIELNPKENKWRYGKSFNPDSGLPPAVSYIGCNKDGYVKEKTKKGSLGSSITVPEYLMCFDFADFPLAFNGAEKWDKPNSLNNIVSIFTAGDSSFVVRDLTGATICEVDNGSVVSGWDNVEYYPHAGYVEGLNANHGGRLIVPGSDLRIEYISGSDITLVGMENAINIAASDKVKMDVSMAEGRVALLESENADIDLQITELYDSDAYSSVELAGNLQSKDVVTLQFENDALAIEGKITGESSLAMYTDHEEDSESRHITTLDRDNESAIVDDIRGTAPVNGVRVHSDVIMLGGVGESTFAEATVLPWNAENKTVIWEISDTAIASVDSSGMIIANGYGTTTLTAKTHDGEYTSSCSVEVLHRGDINADEKVTLADAVMAARIATALDQPNDARTDFAADVNMDDAVNVHDVMQICKTIIGLEQD